VAVGTTVHRFVLGDAATRPTLNAYTCTGPDCSLTHEFPKNTTTTTTTTTATTIAFNSTAATETATEASSDTTSSFTDSGDTSAVETALDTTTLGLAVGIPVGVVCVVLGIVLALMARLKLTKRRGTDSASQVTLATTTDPSGRTVALPVSEESERA